MTDGVPWLTEYISGWRIVCRLGFGVDLVSAPFTGLLTDVSAFLLQSANVSITRGAVDEQQQAQPSQCSFVLKNLDGRFSLRRAASPYWPYMKLGIPAQISLIDPSLVEHERFSGYITEVAPTIDETGKLSLVTITAMGVSSRLSQGNSNLASPLQRALSKQSTCYAYWSFESSGADLNHSPAFQPGVQPATFYDGNWGADTSIVGSAGLPVFNADTFLVATIPGVPTISSWQVCWFYHFPVAPTNTVLLAQVDTPGGTATSWQLLANSTAASITGFAPDGSTVDTFSFTPLGIFGGPVSARLYMTASAGTVTWHLDWFPATGAISGFGTGPRTYSGATGQPRAFRIPPDTNLVNFAVGHLAVFTPTPSFDLDHPARAYAGEDAVTRQARLCGEEGIPYTAGGFTSGRLMGAQGQAPFVQLMNDATDVDGGTLEDCSGFGYIMHINDTRYNLGPAMLVSRTAFQVPLDPLENYYTIKNLWTVTRTSGASVTGVASTGPYQPTGVGGIGTSPDQQTLNLSDDSTLVNRMNWNIHLGTLDADRVPNATIYLHKQTSLIATWVGIQAGIRVTATTTPTLGATLPLDVRVYGWTEQFSQFIYTVVANTAPDIAYRVLQVQPANVKSDYSRIGSGTAVAAAAAAVGATTLQVHTPAINGWTALGTDYPQHLLVHGQNVTALMRGTIMNSNPYFESTISPWVGGFGATVSVSATQAFEGSQSAKVVPDGVTANPFLQSEALAVVPGRRYFLATWVFMPVNYPAGFNLTVDWYTAGLVYISSSANTNTAIAANTWTRVDTAVTPPATAVFAKLDLFLNGTPTTAQLFYADNVYMFKAGELVYDEFQDRTVANGWGSDQFGNAWTPDSNAADFAVSGGVANITPSAATSNRTIATPAARACHLLCRLGQIATPTTGPAKFGLMACHTNASNFYAAFVEVATTGITTARIQKTVAGVTTTLASQVLPFQVLPSQDLTAGNMTVSLVNTVTGSSNQLDFRVNAQGNNVEPIGVTVTATDSSLSATGVGVYAQRGGAAPASFQVLAFLVLSPQNLTVDPTTITTAISAGDSVDSYPPLVVSL